MEPEHSSGKKPLPRRGSGKSPSAAPSGAPVDEESVSNRPLSVGFPPPWVSIDEQGTKPISDHFGHTGSGLSDAHWRGEIASPDQHVELISRTGSAFVPRRLSRASSGQSCRVNRQSFSDSSRFCRAGRQVALAAGNWPVVADGRPPRSRIGRILIPPHGLAPCSERHSGTLGIRPFLPEDLCPQRRFVSHPSGCNLAARNSTPPK
jgi:hypothetical protein